MLTPRVESLVRREFPSSSVTAVLGALSEWRISYEADPPGERLLAAVVLVAGGDPDRLDRGLTLGESDWRDLLVAGGLEHADWSAELDRRLAG